MSAGNKKPAATGDLETANRNLDIRRVKELLKMIRESKSVADKQQYRMISYLLNMAEAELVDIASAGEKQ